MAASEDAAALLLQGRSRETGIRRDRFGRWTDQGQPLQHRGLCDAFDRWLERAPDGRFRVRNAINWGYVEIEGTQNRVKSVIIDSNSIVLRLSSGSQAILVSDTLRYDAHGVLYCFAGEPAEWVSFGKQASFQLAPLLEEQDGGGTVLRIAGTAHPVLPWRPSEKPSGGLPGNREPADVDP